MPAMYLKPLSYTFGVATFDITLGILYFSKICETGKPCDDQSGPTNRSTLSTVASFS